MTPKEQVLEDIAKRHFLIDTLATRGTDSDDFYEVAVWCIKAALEEAYRAGTIASAIDVSSEQ